MKITSIAAHLRPYSIIQKRRTTINNAFASAIATTDTYDDASIREALVALDQNPAHELVCVYCDELAETWDHLHPLVSKGEFSGYGHVIRNLVPCCKQCNSRKGSRHFRNWLLTSGTNDASKRIARLEAYSASLHTQLSPRAAGQGDADLELMKRYSRLREEVMQLLHEADMVAAQFRSSR